MNLLEYVQPDNPFRPWIFALGACVMACLPRGSRRLGGILFFVVIGVGVIYFFLDHAFKTFTPG